MTRSDHLRQALDVIDSMPPLEGYSATVLAAARFALRVWEGDEQLVEKVAWAVHEAQFREYHDRYLRMARAVLAAITEEEQ